MTPPLNRRDFLAQATAATAALAAARPAAGRRRAARDLPKSPTDKVTLGKTGIQVSLVGMGTGSHRLGPGEQPDPARASRSSPGSSATRSTAGVCLFDVADQYGSHVYLREALKGVPRDKYVIQTKTHATKFADARSHLERYRMELGVDMIDIVLLHCMTEGRLARREPGVDGVPDEGQGGGDHPRPRHELPRHGPAAHRRPRTRSSRSTSPGSTPRG